jgi:hypothetical protein
MREAGRRDEADVARADDANGFAAVAHAPVTLPAAAARPAAHAYWPMRCSERAMSIICLFVSSWVSEFDTQ